MVVHTCHPSILKQKDPAFQASLKKRGDEGDVDIAQWKSTCLANLSSSPSPPQKVEI
jgi:hypothetical protein